MSVEQGLLPENLSLYTRNEFHSLFKLKPERLGEVLVYDRNNKKHYEKQIYRYYASYLHTPAFDSAVEKSYMFSNLEDSLRHKDLPAPFVPLLDFAQSIDSRFNQVTINWYTAENFIEMHRDCTAKMISNDSPILCINLNETDNLDACRSFILEDINTKELTSFLLTHGSYIIMKDDLQQTHRHGIGRGVERRISITFRMIREAQS